jgi:hypothetical protein
MTARRFGISRERLRQRLNGSLWEARSLARLAMDSEGDSSDIQATAARVRSNSLPSAHRLLSA